MCGGLRVKPAMTEGVVAMTDRIKSPVLTAMTEKVVAMMNRIKSPVLTPD
jgi:hypothetical protein